VLRAPHGHVVRTFTGGVVDNTEVPLRGLPAPQASARRVQHGGPQVAERRAVIAHSRPVPVQRDERVLHDLLCRSRVVDEQARRAEQRPVVLPEQRLDRGARVELCRRRWDGAVDQHTP
jgi:hypothetical protein